MNIKDFIAKSDKWTQGGFTLLIDNKVPQSEIWLIGEAKGKSARLTAPWHDLEWLANHLIETCEFLYRRQKIEVRAFAVHELNEDRIQEAMALFCDPDKLDDVEEIPEWKDDGN